jgi:Protein of unknown function (DUF3810)
MRRASAGRRWAWVLLGAAAYGLHLAFGKDSPLVENVYSRGVFVGLRWLWDRTVGFSPLPVIYIIPAVILLWSVVRTIRGYDLKANVSRHAAAQYPHIVSGKRGRSCSSVWKKAGRGLLLIASWAGALVLLFYILWGFNYSRIGLEKQLDLEVTPLDPAAVKAEAEGTARVLEETRASIPGATKDALGGAVLPHDLEGSVRGPLSKVLADAGFPVPGRPRVRPLWPGGLLMRLSSSGFYFPYGGESYIAGNLTAAEKPFVTAHEMVHAYGITDEGAANFLGFLACESSADPVVRYSGLLSYWEYLFSELARAAGQDAARLAAGLPEGVRADIQAAFENWKRYRGPAQAAAEAVYERYLKSQGIAEGTKSYDRFVLLVFAWKRREVR